MICVINIAGYPEKAAPRLAMLHIEDGVQTDQPTDRPTDRPTGLPSDIVTYRAAEVQLTSQSSHGLGQS